MSAAIAHHISGTRVVKNTFSGVDGKIKEFEDKFRELKLGFQGHSILVTQIKVLQTKILAQQGLDGVNHIGMLKCFCLL